MVAVACRCVNPQAIPVPLWSNLPDTRMLCENYPGNHC